MAGWVRTGHRIWAWAVRMSKTSRAALLYIGSRIICQRNQKLEVAQQHKSSTNNLQCVALHLFSEMKLITH